jgi:hypothetical protein
VAELMRRELGTSTKANESARRPQQVARFSLSVSRFAGWKRTQGALSKEIVVPFRSSLLRPVRNRQSAHIKTGNRTGKGRQIVARRASLNQLSARSERQLNGRPKRRRRPPVCFGTGNGDAGGCVFWASSYASAKSRRSFDADGSIPTTARIPLQ